MYGSDNSGPAREVWRVGDRVKLIGTRFIGKVASPPYNEERSAFQTGYVWVKWDDIEASWANPNSLDVV